MYQRLCRANVIDRGVLGGMLYIRNIVNYCVEFGIAFDMPLSLIELSSPVTLLV